MIKHHYLGRVRVGRQINYAIVVDGIIDGAMTFAYPMVSAPIDGVSPDEVLEFARLYLQSNMPHVASCAIGKALKRIVRDWVKLFPAAKPPRLVVSWSDRTLHKGTIYKAANFCWLKISKPKARGRHRYGERFAGRRNMDSFHWHEKDCWIYRLN